MKVGFWVIKTKELQILSHYVLIDILFLQLFSEQYIQCYLMTINSLLCLSRARNSYEEPQRVSGAACVRVADCALLSVLICYEHLSSAPMISIFQVKKSLLMLIAPGIVNNKCLEYWDWIPTKSNVISWKELNALIRIFSMLTLKAHQHCQTYKDSEIKIECLLHLNCLN